MANVLVDTIFDARAVEEYGELKEATRTAIVKVPKVNGAGIGDFFSAAMLLLGNDFIPGAPLSPSYPRVWLVRRIPSFVGIDGSYATIKIDLEYEQMRGADDAGLALRGGSSITQIKTQKKRDGTVLYITYGATEEEKTANKIRAEFDVPEVQGHFSREVVKETTDPDSIVNAWINKVNDETWRGLGPRKWLCSNVEYELVTKTSAKLQYRFQFQFQSKNDADGWTYFCVWRDKDGNIPDDVTGTNGTQGVLQLMWHEEAPFKNLFT